MTLLKKDKKVERPESSVCETYGERNGRGNYLIEFLVFNVSSSVITTSKQRRTDMDNEKHKW